MNVGIVIASPDQVRGFSTRNPVLAWHWIPDQVRDDSCWPGMTKLHYFNQPRFLKYHIGTSALATISTIA